MSKQINGVVRIGYTTYRAGDEDELAKKLPAAQIARLQRAGVLKGAWESEPAPTPAPGSDLPEDFPGREALCAAGLASRAAVAAASDEQLVALEGIGAKTVEKIRASLA